MKLLQYSYHPALTTNGVTGISSRGNIRELIGVTFSTLERIIKHQTVDTALLKT